MPYGKHRIFDGRYEHSCRRNYQNLTAATTVEETSASSAASQVT